MTSLAKHRPILLPSNLQRLTIFNLVGALGAFVQLTVLAILLSLGVHYLAATAMAVQAAVVHNFCWHKRHTWRDRAIDGGCGMLRRLLKFNLTVGVVSITQNLVLMKLLSGVLGVHYLAANVASIGVCSLVNFLLCDRLVFARLPSSAGGMAQEGASPTSKLFDGRKE